MESESLESSDELGVILTNVVVVIGDESVGQK